MSTPAYSPGLEGIVAGETAICTVDGGLSYRGYGVGDLAEHCSFDEVAHLLLHGELPSAAQLAAFHSRVAAARRLPPPLKDLLGALPKWTTPLDALRTAVSALGHFDQDAADNSHDANLRKAERLLAQIPVAIAYILAMSMLGLHVVHGVWSMFQSIGVAHPKYTPKFKSLATASAAFLFLGNISIPIAVMTGLIR